MQYKQPILGQILLPIDKDQTLFFTATISQAQLGSSNISASAQVSQLSPLSPP